MVKKSNSLKTFEIQAIFEDLLRSLLRRIPGLEIVALQREANVAPGRPERADLLAEVKTGDRKRKLIIEHKRFGEPRVARSAVLQLESYIKQLPQERCTGVFVAPFISEESAKICTDAGISYADLAGNARLAFDQVFIETRCAENPFREKKEIRSLFSPRSARALRTLLQGPLRPWKTNELAKSAQVSLGWASAVRRGLLAREWAQESKEGLLVTRPDKILDSWAVADDWGKRTHTYDYSTLIADPMQLALKTQEVLGSTQLAFTQWFAAWLRHPYTTPTIVTAYVKEIPDETLVSTELLARPLSSGLGGLRLVVPKDAGVFNPSQTLRGFSLASDVQIYLDLLGAGFRGEEQANELRRWPDFSGGWA